jgi:uncharacterized phage protein gp47/JayE
VSRRELFSLVDRVVGAGYNFEADISIRQRMLRRYRARPYNANSQDVISLYSSH